MNVYPDGFREFSDTAGRLRTKASKQSFKYVLAALQAQHPTWDIDRWQPSDLTKFCLAGDVAPKTIKHRRAVLRSFFEWAEWKGYCSTNPSSTLKFTVVPGQHQVRHGTWLSEPEVAQVIRSCPDDFRGRRDRLILMFGFLMGIRLAAIADLRWDQLSSDLSVLELVVKGQKRTRKGVPAQLRAELARWRQEAPGGAVAIIPGLHELGLVNRSVQPCWDRPLGRAGVTSAVKLAGQRCELKISPHDMRRTLGGLMEEKGYAVTDIQRALDHSNVGTTSTYLNHNPNKTEQVTGGISFEL
jgi:integrase/recombinase XerC